MNRRRRERDDTCTAHRAVEHHGVNVLCLGARVIRPAVAAEIVPAFLGAVVSDQERYVQRRAKVNAIERTREERDTA